MADEQLSPEPPSQPPEQKQEPFKPQVPRLFSGARKSWKFVLGFILFSLIIWSLEFVYQFYVLIPGEVAGSLVRTHALTGTTFISIALFLSAVMKIKPAWGRFWYLRRSFGVMGTAFVLLHILAVFNFFFQWDLAAPFYSLNPLENPIIFGVIAFPILFVMALTSTDWAVAKMGYPKWKALHRLVYFAFLASVLHFITIDPALFENVAGLTLLIFTFLALAGELYWFVWHIVRKRTSWRGVTVGAIVIILWIVLGYLIFFVPQTMVDNQTQQPGQNTLEQDIEMMTEFMETNELPIPDEVTQEELDFEGVTFKTGSFQNINYMTSGAVELAQKDGDQFVMFGDDFSTPNGPDLVVYLTKNTAPSTRDDVANGLTLGPLKSLNGKQVYDIPAGTDTSQFNSVTIHCRAFNVPWSYAPLN